MSIALSPFNFLFDMWHQTHQLQSFPNSTNYWPGNGQLSLECSAFSTTVKERAQEQSQPPWMCVKHGMYLKDILSTPQFLLVYFLIPTGPWRLILGDSYAHPSHTVSHLHTPPPELLSVHLHNQLVDKPRITMWSCLLKAHEHLLALSVFYSLCTHIRSP